MSRPRQIKRRKRRTGYINLTPPQALRRTFFSFKQLAEHLGRTKA